MREVRQIAIAALMALVTVGLVLVVSPVVDGGEAFARENEVIAIAGVCLFNSLYVALRVNDIGDVIADAAAGGSEKGFRNGKGERQ